MPSIVVPVTGSGSTGLKRWLMGWWFTNTHATNSVTIKVHATDVNGAILWQATIKAGDSIGDDYDYEPISLRHYSASAPDVYVEITGTGTVQGGVRGL